MALDEEKFDRWQPNLLALLNEPKLKRFARWRMGLRNRAALDEEIIAIDPHHITVPLGVNQFRSSFSSQPAIQKGLYHGFKPVFWGMHAYDWLLRLSIMTAVALVLGTFLGLSGQVLAEVGSELDPPAAPGV